MSSFDLPTPPTQTGVQYENCPAPLFALEDINNAGTFIAGSLVPNADSFSIKKGANTGENMDQSGDVSNFGSSNHHLVASGDFYVKSGVDVKIPCVGEIVQDNESTPRNWVVTSEPEVTGFSGGGMPLTVKLELKYWPKVNAAV